MALSKFWSGHFGKNWAWEGAYFSYNFFGRLRRALELLISVWMQTIAIFYGYRVDTIIPEEKTNLFVFSCSRSFFRLKKKKHSTILQRGDWNLNSRVLWYAEYDGVNFIKILDFYGCFPLFSKIRHIFSRSSLLMSEPKLEHAQLRWL